MEPVMPQIETVVMLMLENRSLDSVLGWLHQGVILPDEQVFPPGSSKRFNGITPEMYNEYEGEKYAPPCGTQDQADPWRTPRWNPHEIWEHVTTQFYADGDGMLTGTPWVDPPTMTGFVRDYSDRNDGVAAALNEVMGGFTAEQLPVLYGLAQNFAVSDRWFSSVPTETNPNRAFSVCGTSCGAVDNSDARFYDAPTLFNALTNIKTWAVYWQYHGIADMDPILPYRNCFTEDLFPRLHAAVKHGDGTVAHYGDFLTAVRDGKPIPQFCYIEPFSSGGIGFPDGEGFLGLQGNDYHAPAWIGQAEFDLNELYRALRASPQWEHMLFVITFDEHGGTWDHEPPPQALPPDQSGSRFGFDWLGARVPMILVSPFVRPGTVFRAPAGSSYDFDHTSFLATMLKWAGIDPATAGMGERVAHAPTFDDVLSPTGFDNDLHGFTVPGFYEGQGGTKGLHLFDFDANEPPLHEFKDAVERSSSVGELLDRLFDSKARRSSSAPTALAHTRTRQGSSKRKSSRETGGSATREDAT